MVANDIYPLKSLLYPLIETLAITITDEIMPLHSTDLIATVKVTSYFTFCCHFEGFALPAYLHDIANELLDSDLSRHYHLQVLERFLSQDAVYAFLRFR